MYNNRVLIGNWHEERAGNFGLQKYGGLESTHQKDYREHAMPAWDDRDVWRTKERALGLPIELCREHGRHNAYKNNMCTMYDLNCKLTYNQPTIRSFKPIRKALWVPQQSFTSNYGPGRNELVKRKQERWMNDRREYNPITEYQNSFTLK